MFDVATRFSVERLAKPGQDHPHGLKDGAPVVQFFTAALERQK